jgi:MFS family permease
MENDSHLLSAAIAKKEIASAAAVLPASGSARGGVTAPEPWPSPVQAWYAVFISALILMVSFVDRSIVTLLVEPIKRDLHLTDVQMSLLMGFAFVCFYVTVGLPVARLADYKSRRLIMGVAVGAWSIMTALCGVARSFPQLFLCRIGVGAGEGCTGPANYSMLADLFPKEKLARAIAVVNFGIYAGNGLALIIGGALTARFVALPPQRLPVVGTIPGWQLTFFVVGLPGLLVAALMRTVREPKRRGRMDGQGSTGVPVVPLRQVASFMRAHAAIYGSLFLGIGIQNLVTFGVATWGAAFYLRTFHWSPARYGWVQGVITLSVAPLGALTGGFLTERAARKGHEDANLRVVRLATWLALPGLVLYPLMPTAALAIAVSIYATFVASWTAGPINAALQVITPNQMRAQMTGVFLVFYNLLGLGLGPTVVALYTEYVFHSERLVGRSMALTALTVGPIAALLWGFAMKPYARSLESAKAWR